MSRAEILAEVLAHLEAERFAPVAPRPPARPPAQLDPITPEQAAANRQALEDALSGDALSNDPVVIAWIERKAG